MEAAGTILVVAIAIPLVYALLKYKSAKARQTLEQYLQDSKFSATIEKMGMPPLRLWLRNRKGDAWFRLRMADGSVRWARVGFRRRLLGETIPVELFE